MECAFCNRTTEGCACIKCSQCQSHYHLECVPSEQRVGGSNSWRCCRCESLRAAQTAPLVDPTHA